jgi:galactitol-specific phosphotransferase system IIB component
MFFYPSLMRVLSKKIKKYLSDHDKNLKKTDFFDARTIPTRDNRNHILISSFAIAKNITPISGVPMTLYLHSPMQYIRTHYDEYKEKLT